MFSSTNDFQESSLLLFSIQALTAIVDYPTLHQHGLLMSLASTFCAAASLAGAEGAAS
jgi:hypothetical protein